MWEEFNRKIKSMMENNPIVIKFSEQGEPRKITLEQ